MPTLGLVSKKKKRKIRKKFTLAGSRKEEIKRRGLLSFENHHPPIQPSKSLHKEHRDAHCRLATLFSADWITLLGQKPKAFPTFPSQADLVLSCWFVLSTCKSLLIQLQFQSLVILIQVHATPPVSFQHNKFLHPELGTSVRAPSPLRRFLYESPTFPEHSVV